MIPVVVMEEPEDVDLDCFAQVHVAQVQAEPLRRHKAAQVVDLTHLGGRLDSTGVETVASIRVDLQFERRKKEVPFVVRLHRQPICAVPGIGARRQAVQLKTLQFEQYDRDSELIKFFVSEPEFPLEVLIDPK